MTSLTPALSQRERGRQAERREVEEAGVSFRGKKTKRNNSSRAVPLISLKRNDDAEREADGRVEGDVAAFIEQVYGNLKAIEVGSPG